MRAEEGSSAEGLFFRWTGSSRCSASRLLHHRTHAHGYHRSHADRNRNGDASSYRDASAHTYSDADAHTNPDAHTHTYSYPHADPATRRVVHHGRHQR